MANSFGDSAGSAGSVDLAARRPGKPSLLIVASGFFPEATDSSHRLLEYCERLSKRGVHVSVLTEAKHKSWPSEITVARTRIFRVQAEASGGLFRRSRNNGMHQWLAANSKRFQGIYFDSPWHRVHEFLMRNYQSADPWSWMRYDANQCEEKYTDSGLLTPAYKAVLARVNEVLVPNAFSHQKMASAAIPGVTSQRIVDQSTLRIDRSIGARRNARLLLSETSQDLFLRQKDRFVLIPGDFGEKWEVRFALRALGALLQSDSHLRCWVLGEGPERKRIYRYLKDHSIHYAVSLPGVFTDVTELLQAADLCLFPGEHAGLSWWATVCAKNRIPMLLPESAKVSSNLSQRESILNFEAGSVQSLREAIQGFLQNAETIEQACMQLQDSLLESDDDCQNTVERIAQKLL